MNNKSKEQKILDFINDFIANNGYPPSIREICSALNIKSTSTVHGYISSLEEKGKLKRSRFKKRAIMPTKQKNFEYMEIPVLGDIAAGTPIIAEENIQDYFPLPMSFAKNKDLFMLKVVGNSMVEAGILNGDYVIVRKQSYAQNNDIVVALIDNEATVKTYYKEKDCIRLQPQNSMYSPIILNKVMILGKVVGVYRIY